MGRLLNAFDENLQAKVIAAEQPTQNPEIPKKRCVCANLFEKFA